MTSAVSMPEGTGFFISWRAEPADPNDPVGRPSRDAAADDSPRLEGDVKLHFNSVDEFKQFVKDQPVKGQVFKVGPFLEDPRVHGLGDANSVAYCAIWNPYASEAECEQIVVFNKECQEAAEKAYAKAEEAESHNTGTRRN